MGIRLLPNLHNFQLKTIRYVLSRCRERRIRNKGKQGNWLEPSLLRLYLTQIDDYHPKPSLSPSSLCVVATSLKKFVDVRARGLDLNYGDGAMSVAFFNRTMEDRTVAYLNIYS